MAKSKTVITYKEQVSVVRTEHDSSRSRIWLTYALQVKAWPEQSVQRLSVCYDGSLLFCDFREVNLKITCGADPFTLCVCMFTVLGTN